MNRRIWASAVTLLGAAAITGCGSTSGMHQTTRHDATAGAGSTMMSAARLMPMGNAATAPSGHVTLVIRHQIRGCHSWSYEGGRSRAAQTLRLGPGASLGIVDNDVMPHRLVQVGGPPAALTHAAMTHMQAGATIRFPAAGTYRFRTVAGEDSMPGIKTVGPDNVLRLVVIVA
jgi:hypothetical protein